MDLGCAITVFGAPSLGGVGSVGTGATCPSGGLPPTGGIGAIGAIGAEPLGTGTGTGIGTIGGKIAIARTGPITTGGTGTYKRTSKNKSRMEEVFY
jgi:hypothetical protein